jgi:hypothetical protein
LKNLKKGTKIEILDTGYTNKRIIIRWLEHFIKRVGVGSNKLWKLLLLDGHVTHNNP